jgi:hypothetical protein
MRTNGFRNATAWRAPAAFIASMSVLAVLLVSACSSYTSEVPDRPLTVDLTAPRTTAGVGDTILFRVDATGKRLLGLIINYGDGRADSISTQNAQTATANIPYAYTAKGMFTVVATVIELTGESVNDDLAMTIN